MRPKLRELDEAETGDLPDAETGGARHALRELDEAEAGGFPSPTASLTPYPPGALLTADLTRPTRGHASATAALSQTCHGLHPADVWLTRLALPHVRNCPQPPPAAPGPPGHHGRTRETPAHHRPLRLPRLRAHGSLVAALTPDRPPAAPTSGFAPLPTVQLTANRGSMPHSTTGLISPIAQGRSRAVSQPIGLARLSWCTVAGG